METLSVLRVGLGLIYAVSAGALCSCAGPMQDSGQVTAPRDARVAVLVAALEHSFATDDYLADEFTKVMPKGPPIAAYAVDAGSLSDEVAKALQGWKDPVRIAGEQQNNNGQYVVNESTGERVILWNARVLDLSDDGAIVNLGVVVGGRAASGFEVTLRSDEGEWKVVRRDPTWIG